MAWLRPELETKRESMPTPGSRLKLRRRLKRMLKLRRMLKPGSTMTGKGGSRRWQASVESVESVEQENTLLCGWLEAVPNPIS